MEQQKYKLLSKQFYKKLVFALLSFMPLPLIAIFINKYVHANYLLTVSQEKAFNGMLFAGIITLILGILILVAMFGFTLFAFINRHLQTWSLNLGWNILLVMSLIQLVAQGVLVTLFSYWIPVLLFNIYFPKVVMLVGFFSIAAIYYAIKGIFSRIDVDNRIEGKLISQADAPSLWQRVNTLASTLKTPAPEQIIAGIDANFYVTEAPIELLNGEKYQGRTLYISLPLLQQLSLEEADAVLLHELAHLHYGDTKQSKKLAPALRRCDIFLAHISSSSLAKFACQPLSLYRALFSLALMRDSRKRELMADKAAAEKTSAKAIINALIKINAYACFQSKLVNKIYEENDTSHVENLSEKINAELYQYADSASFLTDMAENEIPHPFDSHPELSERMTNVNYTLVPSMYRAVVHQTPTSTWLAFIPTANEITKELWMRYENELKEQVEYKMSYTCNPANEEEERIILKFFPPVKFLLKEAKEVSITYKGICMPDGTEFLWEDLDADYGCKSDKKNDFCVFRVTNEKNNKLSYKQLNFPKKLDKEPFLSAFYGYWGRNLNMHEYINAQSAEQSEIKQ